MADHRFIPGVTDAGKPRAAKGGFPYPGHGTLADIEHDRQRMAEIQRQHDKDRDYQRKKRSRLVRKKEVVDVRAQPDSWIATFSEEVA